MRAARVRPSSKEHPADRLVDAAVRRHCSGVPIDILKIGDVFKAGRAAFDAGGDIERATVRAYFTAAGVALPAAFADPAA